MINYSLNLLSNQVDVTTVIKIFTFETYKYKSLLHKYKTTVYYIAYEYIKNNLKTCDVKNEFFYLFIIFR